MIKSKNLTLLIGFFVLAMVSCNPGLDRADTAKAVKVSVLTFEQQAAELIDKAIVIEGTVLHTCKHSGKRMFLVDGNDSIRVEVTAGKNITKFDEKLVGSRVLVVGTLKEEKIDEKYLNEWENEVKKPVENHNAGIHTGAQGHEDQGTQDKLDQINSLRDDLKKSGKDHLSFYSVEADRFEELKK